MLKPTLYLGLALLLACNATGDGYIYRFKVDGRVLIKGTVPADLAPLGYEVLNTQGRVIRVVPRQLTPEEIAERDRQEEIQRQYNARVAEQASSDKEILLKYSNLDEVNRAHKRKKEYILSKIEQQNRSIIDMKKKIDQAQQKAADHERQGRKVPGYIKQDIERYRLSVKDEEKGIALNNISLSTLEKEFSQVRHRFKVLQVYPLGTLPEEVDENRL